MFRLHSFCIQYYDVCMEASYFAAAIELDTGSELNGFCRLIRHWKRVAL